MLENWFGYSFYLLEEIKSYKFRESVQIVPVCVWVNEGADT